MDKATRVTVGVCGGVAAYKAGELVRSLQQVGLDVSVVMTRAAEEFVRPLTFASLTRAEGHYHLLAEASEAGPDAEAADRAHRGGASDANC